MRAGPVGSIRSVVVVFFLGLPLTSAQAGQQSKIEKTMSTGGCKSSDKSSACDLCQITIKNDAEPAAGDRYFTLACPTMAAGHYKLDIAIPVKIVPPKPGAIQYHVTSSIAGNAHNAGGYDKNILPDSTGISWNWTSESGATISKEDIIKIDEDAAVDFLFQVTEARYYYPKRKPSEANLDGKLFVQKGATFRIERAQGNWKCPN